jgi:hypothetical protein
MKPQDLLRYKVIVVPLIHDSPWGQNSQQDVALTVYVSRNSIRNCRVEKENNSVLTKKY